MNTGKTIQIFLPDGNPRSIRIAEITSRTVQAILIPRQKLEDATARNELSNVGIYFLIGNTEEDGILYVGEAEETITRLKTHNREKEFWTHAIAIISKTQYFTKTHIKYLEWYCYDQAKKVGRYKLENTNIPTKPFTSESMEADLYDNFDTLRVLVATLGYPMFDEMVKPERKQVLFCKGKDALAEGEYTEDGLVVFAKSTCNLVESKASGSWVSGMRTKLIESGVLVKNDNGYVFTANHIFSSPSAAAATVLARRANGWIEWKYKDGKTLDEVIRQKKTNEIT